MSTTKVNIVTSTSGDINNKTLELEYLNMMAMNHFKWHEFYQNKIKVLQEDREDKSVSSI